MMSWKKHSIFKIVLVVILLFLSKNSFSQNYSAENLIKELLDSDIELGFIKTNLNALENNTERGEVLLKAGNELISVHHSNMTVMENFALVSCLATNWELESHKSAELEKLLFQLASDLIDKGSEKFRFPVCAALNKTNFYFGKITKFDSKIRNHVCEGNYEEALKVADPDLALKNEKAMIDFFKEPNWKSNKRYSFYPFRTQLRSARRYVQKAVTSDSNSIKEENLNLAIDTITELLSDSEKLSKTRNGWRWYTELLVRRLIYQSRSSDQKKEAEEIIKYFADHADESRNINFEDKTEPVTGHWPTVYEIHTGNISYIKNDKARKLFEQVKILDKKLAKFGKLEGIPVNYVDMALVERLFPFAQQNYEAECRGWKQRSYNPNSIMKHTNSCLGKTDIETFDRCMSEIEANDWKLRFATIRYNKNNKKLSEDLQINLQKELTDEQFKKFFKDRTIEVSPLETNNDHYEVFVDPRNFSTREVEILYQKFDEAKFIKKLRLPRPLFARPKEY